MLADKSRLMAVGYIWAIGQACYTYSTVVYPRDAGTGGSALGFLVSGLRHSCVSAVCSVGEDQDSTAILIADRSARRSRLS